MPVSNASAALSLAPEPPRHDLRTDKLTANNCQAAPGFVCLGLFHSPAAQIVQNTVQPTIRNRTIALAALFQAAHLVDRIARTGMADVSAMETSLHSLFSINAASIDDIFNGLTGLRAGLLCLREQLGAEPGKRNPLLTRYVINLLHLERKLREQPDTGEALRRGIEATGTEFPLQQGTLRTELVTELAELYQTTISQLGPRIMVQGDQGHLNNANNAARIRSLLLAGVRAAVLWQQAGGSRWQLLFQRKRFHQHAQVLLEETA